MNSNTLSVPARIDRTISKYNNEAIDRLNVSMEQTYKLLAIAGLIDQKYNSLTSLMSKEEKEGAINELKGVILSAEILIRDTIPIKDSLICNSDDIECRVLIFDKEDWIALTKSNYEGTVTIVGTIITSASKYNEYCVVPIVMAESDSIQPQLGLEELNAYKKENGLIITRNFGPEIECMVLLLCKTMIHLLSLWYATQITLLNPLIKYRTVEKQVIIPPKKTRNGKKKSGAPKIKYFKTIYVESDQLDQFFEETKNEKGEIQRHCLMWYVTGHWRQYKNGKRIFIQGYWKGEGRFSGIENETRQRELVLDEDDLPKERIPKPKTPARRLEVNPAYYENVRCECGKCSGTGMLTKTCPSCGKMVMYRKGE